MKIAIVILTSAGRLRRGSREEVVKNHAKTSAGAKIKYAKSNRVPHAQLTLNSRSKLPRFRNPLCQMLYSEAAFSIVFDAIMRYDPTTPQTQLVSNAECFDEMEHCL